MTSKTVTVKVTADTAAAVAAMDKFANATDDAKRATRDVGVAQEKAARAARDLATAQSAGTRTATAEVKAQRQLEAATRGVESAMADVGAAQGKAASAARDLAAAQASGTGNAQAEEKAQLRLVAATRGVEGAMSDASAAQEEAARAAKDLAAAEAAATRGATSEEKAQVRLGSATRGVADAMSREAKSARKLTGIGREQTAQAEKQTAALKKQAAATKRLSSIEGKLGSIAKASKIQAASLGQLAGQARAVAQALDELSQRAIAYDDVTSNLAFSTDKAAAATGGLVDSFTLAQQASQANRLEVAKNSEEFARLARIGSQLARTTGQSATKGVEDLTIAFARQSPKILDNLGIKLGAIEAEVIHAASLGKTTTELTNQERAQSFVKAGFIKAERALDGVSVASDSAALSIQKAKVALTNMADEALQVQSNAAALSETLESALVGALFDLGVEADKAKLIVREVFSTLEAVADKAADTFVKLSALRLFADVEEDSKILAGIVKDGDKLVAQAEERARAAEEAAAAEAETKAIVEARFAAGVALAAMSQVQLDAVQETLARERARGTKKELINKLLKEEIRLTATLKRAQAESDPEADPRKVKRLREEADQLDKSLRIEIARQEGARAAGRKRTDPRLAETARLEFDISLAKRQQADLDRKGFSTRATRLAGIEREFAAERKLLEFKISGAKTEAEMIKASTDLADLAQAERFARADLIRADEDAAANAVRAAADRAHKSREADVARDIELEKLRSQRVLDERLRAVGALDAAKPKFVSAAAGALAGIDVRAGGPEIRNKEKAAAQLEFDREELSRLREHERTKTEALEVAALTRSANAEQFEQLKREREQATLDLLVQQDAVKESLHQAELARVAETEAAQERLAENIVKVSDKLIGAGARVTKSILSVSDARFAAKEAALAQGKSETDAAAAGRVAAQQARASQLQSLRDIFIVKAAGEAAEAIASAASLNFPGALAHGAAAAAFAAAAAATGGAARTQQKAGFAGAAGIAERDAKERERSDGKGDDGTTGSGGPNIPPPVSRDDPPSTGPGASGQAFPGGQHAGPSQTGGRTVNINIGPGAINTLATSSEALGLAIRKAVQDSVQDQGSL